MLSELINKYRALCKARDAEVIDDAVFLAGLDKLRASYNAMDVDKLIGLKIDPSNKTDAYLADVRAKCISIPLLGIHEQRDLQDTASVNLAQVYTQMTVQRLVPRESFAANQLRSLNLGEFLSLHRGDTLLPHEQRTRVDVLHDDFQQANRRIFSDEIAGKFPLKGTVVLDIPSKDPLVVLRLDNLAKDAHSMSFFGPQLVSESIAANPRLVLLGGPGSGKSTALRYIAFALAEVALDWETDASIYLPGWDRLGAAGALLPIYAPILPLARRLTDIHRPGQAQDVWEYLTNVIQVFDSRGELFPTLREAIREGRALILLDGLDEVAGAASRQRVTEAISDFAQSEPQCRIVVACRVRAYEGVHNQAWRLNGWPCETLADWSPSQTTYFVNAWYRAAAVGVYLNEERCTERIEQLLWAIGKREDLAKLGMRPLLLTIMTLVHLNDGRLPEDRVTLYSRCIDILLEQWELTGREDNAYGRLMDYIGLPHLDAKRLRSLLQDIAFAAHQASTRDTYGQIGRETLQRMVQVTLEEFKHPDPEQGAMKFLDYTDVRAGLLQASNTGDSYVFPHRTFQEYLAGLALVRNVEFVQQIMELREDDRWRVPIFLSMGHCVSEGTLAMSHQLLERLLVAEGRREAQCQRDILLAAEIAIDVAWDRLEKGGPQLRNLREALARALASVAEGTVLSAFDRIQAGLLLAETGDLRPGVCTLPPITIPFEGGAFTIGYPERRARHEDHINTTPTLVAPFELGRYPITNAQYALFIENNGYDSTAPWWDEPGRAWLARDDLVEPHLQPWQRRATKDRPESWLDRRYGSKLPNHPVVGVSWFEAMAFCRWLTMTYQDGYRYSLPSELEWEYAARGEQGRTYPWGDRPQISELPSRIDKQTRTIPVGCFAQYATPSGVLDMLRNVWEWTRSAYAPYPYKPTDGRESDQNPFERQFVMRGASWVVQPLDPHTVDRDPNWPDGLPKPEIGFRVVRYPL